MRSKDPNTKVGACVIDNENRIIGVGYNGLPRGCSDGQFPWERDRTNILENKYPYVVHAEMNAMFNSNTKIDDAVKIIVTEFPCCDCAKHILQTKIREVVYYGDKYIETDNCGASIRMFNAKGIKYHKYLGKLDLKVLRDGKLLVL